MTFPSAGTARRDGPPGEGPDHYGSPLSINILGREGSKLDSWSKKELKELIKKELYRGGRVLVPPLHPRVPVLPWAVGGKGGKKGKHGCHHCQAPQHEGGRAPPEGAHVCLQDTLVSARTGWPKVGAETQEDGASWAHNSRPSGGGMNQVSLGTEKGKAFAGWTCSPVRDSEKGDQGDFQVEAGFLQLWNL